MSHHILPLTGIERHFEVDELIVSKTDTQGRITYANEVFLRVAGYTEDEVLGKPHNIIRHPDMPRCVFRFLWETIEAGKEIFAYVVNRSKCGDHYWVFAHVTPTFDQTGRIVGYHSNRRVASREALEKIQPIYRSLVDLERQYADPKQAWQASLPQLVGYLTQQGLSYDEFIFKLCNPSQQSQRLFAGSNTKCARC